MYQYCPVCKALVSEDDTACPNCSASLQGEAGIQKRGLTQREIAYYVLGFVLLAIAAFYRRDLGNNEDLMNGTVIFGFLVIGSVFWYYIRGRGGIGYPIS
ncbi:MAG: zinc ribbon domain-containing protein [Candidatus Bathyarchaeota archaeon]|nr:zinc ribbon domain-containing protein [Candidatus Bathyarchaeota archaeon]